MAENRSVATYAQPLSRLQVSWGSILAGTLAIFAVAGILWAVCWAIILSATSASVGAVKGALIAAFVTWICTTLIGAFVGGMVAGYLPGNPRRAITMTHGFLAWCLAFLVAGAVNLAFLSGATRTAVGAVTTTTSAVVQSAGTAVGGAAQSPAGLDQKAVSVLESLGYSPAESASMVQSARTSIQEILRGQGPATQQVSTGAHQAVSTARGALDTLISWTAGYVWLWWGTWMVSALLAVAGAGLMVKRARRIPERERVSGSEPIQFTTLRPARTMP